MTKVKNYMKLGMMMIMKKGMLEFKDLHYINQMLQGRQNMLPIRQDRQIIYKVRQDRPFIHQGRQIIYQRHLKNRHQIVFWVRPRLR